VDQTADISELSRTRRYKCSYMAQDDEYAGIPQKNYTKDVTGGWYDAGDHGKYVVTAV